MPAPPSRRLCGASFLAGLSLSWLAACGEGGGGGDSDAQPANPAVGPDVLIIVADALRADHLGCYGSPAPTSPELDALAKESVLVEDCRTVVPTTLASFSSLLTSASVALGIMMLFLILRLICRKTAIAAVVFCLVWGAFGTLQFAGLWGARAGVLGFVVQAFGLGLIIWVLVRFGLLALVAFMVYSNLGNITPLTFDTSAPFFSLGLFYTAVVFALVAYGWHTSLAGRSLMQDNLLKT